MTNQPDLVVVENYQRTAVVIDEAIPSHSNIQEKLKKYQELKEELEKMCVYECHGNTDASSDQVTVLYKYILYKCINSQRNCQRDLPFIVPLKCRENKIYGL